MVFDFAIVLLAGLGETDGVEVGLDAGVGVGVGVATGTGTTIGSSALTTIFGDEK